MTFQTLPCCLCSFFFLVSGKSRDPAMKRGSGRCDYMHCKTSPFRFPPSLTGTAVATWHLPIISPESSVKVPHSFLLFSKISSFHAKQSHDLLVHDKKNKTKKTKQGKTFFLKSRPKAKGPAVICFELNEHFRLHVRLDILCKQPTL